MYSKGWERGETYSITCPNLENLVIGLIESVLGFTFGKEFLLLLICSTF